VRIVAPVWAGLSPPSWEDCRPRLGKTVAPVRIVAPVWAGLSPPAQGRGLWLAPRSRRLPVVARPRCSRRATKTDPNHSSGRRPRSQPTYCRRHIADGRRAQSTTIQPTGRRDIRCFSAAERQRNQRLSALALGEESRDTTPYRVPTYLPCLHPFH